MTNCQTTKKEHRKECAVLEPPENPRKYWVPHIVFVPTINFSKTSVFLITSILRVFVLFSNQTTLRKDWFEEKTFLYFLMNVVGSSMVSYQSLLSRVCFEKKMVFSRFEVFRNNTKIKKNSDLLSNWSLFNFQTNFQLNYNSKKIE